MKRKCSMILTLAMLGMVTFVWTAFAQDYVDIESVATRLSQAETASLLATFNTNTAKTSNSGTYRTMDAGVEAPSFNSPGVIRVIPEARVSSHGIRKTVELVITQRISAGTRIAVQISFENGTAWPMQGWYFNYDQDPFSIYTIWEGGFGSFWPSGAAYFQALFVTPDRGFFTTSARVPVYFVSDPEGNNSTPRITGVEYRNDGYILIRGRFNWPNTPAQVVFGNQVVQVRFGFGDAVVIDSKDLQYLAEDFQPVSVEQRGLTDTFITRFQRVSVTSIPQPPSQSKQ